MSRADFFDLSWFEFNCAAEGYFEDLKQRLGISTNPKMGKPTDAQRQDIKSQSEEWMKAQGYRFYGEPGKT